MTRFVPRLRDSDKEVGLYQPFSIKGEDTSPVPDRAINMSATEANAIMCYGELADAIKRGCTVKTWKTIFGWSREGMASRRRKWRDRSDYRTF